MRRRLGATPGPERSRRSRQDRITSRNFIERHSPISPSPVLTDIGTRVGAYVAKDPRLAFRSHGLAVCHSSRHKLRCNSHSSNE
jgi:hypothetical protein